MRRFIILLVLALASLALAQAHLQVRSVQASSESIVGGYPLEIRVLLSFPAQASDTLPVSSNRPDLCQALPVSVGAGQSQIEFVVPTRAVEEATWVVVSVGEYGSIRDLRIQLQPEMPPVTQLRMPPRMIGGDAGNVTIVLERPSKKAGKLSLQASDNLSIAPQLAVPAGVRQFEAPFTTKMVRQPVTASLSYRGSRPVSGQTQLLPPVEVAGLQLAPDSIEGGQSCQATVSLTAPAPAPARVKLFAPAHLKVPPDVTVAEGSSSGTFSVAAATTRVAQNGAISASTPLGQKSANLAVLPTNSLLAAEAIQYYLMASAKEGWIPLGGWSAKPTAPAKLGALKPLGYTATVAAEGRRQGDNSPHNLLLQLQLDRSKGDWRVTELKIIQIDGVDQPHD